MAEQDITPGRGRFKAKPRLVIIILVIIFLIVLIASSLYVVDQTEQAVLLRFGKYSRISDPGLHFKAPFGIEKNYNVQTQRIQTEEFGYRTQSAGVTSVFSAGDYPTESVMLTGDLNIVDVEWVVQYRIVDPKAWLFNVQNTRITVRDISQSVVNELIGDRAVLDVIGSERPNIEIAAQEQMNNYYKQYGLGVNVTTVKLRNIVPPAGEVQDAFEDVNKSIQDMNRLINEGQEAYNAEIPKARGEAKQMIQVAEGYAAERVNNARGNVARFNAVYEEYVKNRQVTRDRLYIEMMEDVFGNAEGTDLIDRNLENFIPLKAFQDQPQGGVMQ